MKRSVKITLVVAAAIVLLAVLGWRVAVKRAEHAGPQPSASAAASGASAAAVLELSADDLIEVRRQPIRRSIAFTGSLRAVNSAWVKAKVAGELVALTPREGDTVRAGDTVGRIDATEFDWRLRQAEQQAAAAKAQRDVTLRQLDNSRALVAQSFISPTGLETALANDNAAQANLQAAQAAVELARKAQTDALLRAPIGGQVSQRLAQPGERVAVDARILEIVDLSRLEMEAALPPEDAARLTPGAAARLWVEGRPEPLSARVTRINPSAQSGTRAVLAYVSLPGGPGLRAGLFARGEILLDPDAQQAGVGTVAAVVAVPVSALRVDQSRPYLITFDGQRLHWRFVQPGRRGAAAEAAATSEPLVELLGDAPAGTQVLRGSLGLLPDGAAAHLTPRAAGAAASSAASGAPR